MMIDILMYCISNEIDVFNYIRYQGSNLIIKIMFDKNGVHPITNQDLLYITLVSRKSYLIFRKKEIQFSYFTLKDVGPRMKS